MPSEQRRAGLCRLWSVPRRHAQGGHRGRPFRVLLSASGFLMMTENQPKTLYFVRHGEADYNLLDRVNAHPGVRNDLTATGREQAACCSGELAQAAVELI